MFGLIMAGIGAVSSIAGSIMGGASESANASANNDIRRVNEQLEKSKSKLQGQEMIKAEYKNFDNFMKANNQLISSQKNFMNAVNLDGRGSVRNLVENSQQGNFYASEKQVGDNLAEINTKTELILLGQEYQSAIGDYNYKSQQASIQNNTMSSIFGSALGFGMAYANYSDGQKK